MKTPARNQYITNSLDLINQDKFLQKPICSNLQFTLLELQILHMEVPFKFEKKYHCKFPNHLFGMKVRTGIHEAAHAVLFYHFGMCPDKIELFKNPTYPGKVVVSKASLYLHPAYDELASSADKLEFHRQRIQASMAGKLAEYLICDGNLPITFRDKGGLDDRRIRESLKALSLNDEKQLEILNKCFVETVRLIAKFREIILALASDLAAGIEYDSESMIYDKINDLARIEKVRSLFQPIRNSREDFDRFITRLSLPKHYHIEFAQFNESFLLYYNKTLIGFVEYALRNNDDGSSTIFKAMCRPLDNVFAPFTCRAWRKSDEEQEAAIAKVFRENLALIGPKIRAHFRKAA